MGSGGTRTTWQTGRAQNFVAHHKPLATPVPANFMKAPQVFSKDGAPVDSIQYCGGGKDGLLAMKLLESANIPKLYFSYSISRYGSARTQFERAQSVL